MKLREFLKDWRDLRSNTISMRLSNKEKFVIDTLKGSQSYADHYLVLIKYLAGENPDEKNHFQNCFGPGNYEERYNEYKSKKLSLDK